MHFTWKKPNLTTLKQGDLLRKTPALTALLAEVHPHYTSGEYTYFQVLTQSCDLVRRGNSQQCTSRYITLAAVRSLDDILKRKISDIIKLPVEINGTTYCNDEHKYILTEFVRKLFNNNDRDYFFLREEPEYGLIEDSCTILHLSITIRAYQHYGICLESKILELDEVFQAKLGWSVGNLYSRVGTEDYVPGALPDKELFDDLIEKTLQNHIAWIPKNIFSEFKKASKHKDDFSSIRKKVEERLKTKRESKLSQLVALVKNTTSLSPEQEKALKNTFSQNPLVQKILT